MVYNKVMQMATGKSNEMVAVNVMVPRDMRDGLDRVMQRRKWTLAVTVREAIERMLAAEMAEQKPGKR
jgi:predicted DNA-binding protein